MNDASAHIGEVRILKELIQQLAGDLLQCEAVCRYLRGEVERLETRVERYDKAYTAGLERELELLKGIVDLGLALNELEVKYG